jgi:hypothetical protein
MKKIFVGFVFYVLSITAVQTSIFAWTLQEYETNFGPRSLSDCTATTAVLGEWERLTGAGRQGLVLFKPKSDEAAEAFYSQLTVTRVFNERNYLSTINSWLAEQEKVRNFDNVFTPPLDNILIADNRIHTMGFILAKVPTGLAVFYMKHPVDALVWTRAGFKIVISDEESGLKVFVDISPRLLKLFRENLRDIRNTIASKALELRQ